MDNLALSGVYTTTCINPDGSIKWSDVSSNLVTYEGKNSMLDGYFTNRTGSMISYTTFYVSLITGGEATLGNSYANTGVIEATNLIGKRAVGYWTPAARGVKTWGPSPFSITGSGTITGTMIVCGNGESTNTNIPGNTNDPTGVLFSVSGFKDGPKVVNNTDRLLVTYSITL